MKLITSAPEGHVNAEYRSHFRTDDRPGRCNFFRDILRFIANSCVQLLPFILGGFTLAVTVKPFLIIAGTSDMDRFPFIQVPKMTDWPCDLCIQKHLLMCRDIITALPAHQHVQQFMLARTVYGPTLSYPSDVNYQTSVSPSRSAFSRPTSRTQLS